MKPINEINRIKELMGLDLISEASVSSYTNGVREFIEYLFNKEKDAIRGIVRDESAINRIEREGGLSGFSPEEINKIAKSIDSKRLARVIGVNYFVPDKIVGTFKPLVGQLESHAKTYSQIEEQIKSANPVTKLFQRAIGDENIKVPDFIKKADVAANQIYLKRFKEFLKTNHPEIYENMVPKPGYFIKNFTDKIVNKDAQTIRRVWVRVFDPAKKLQKEFNQEYYLALDAISKKEDPSYHFKMMSDILQSTKKWFNKYTSEYWIEWKKEIEKLPRGKEFLTRFESKVKNPAKVFFDETVKHREYYEPFVEEFKAFRQAWPIQLTLKPPFVSFKFNQETFSRLFRFITYGDPRNLAEMRRSLQTKGVSGAISTFLFTRAVIHFGLLPGLIATWKSLWGGIGSLAGSSFYNDPSYSWLDYAKPEDVEGYSRFFYNWGQNYKRNVPEGVAGFVNISLIDDIFRKLRPVAQGAASNETLKMLEEYDKNFRKTWGISPEVSRDSALQQFSDTLRKMTKEEIEEKVNELKQQKENLKNKVNNSTDTSNVPKLDTMNLGF